MNDIMEQFDSSKIDKDNAFYASIKNAVTVAVFSVSFNFKIIFTMNRR